MSVQKQNATIFRRDGVIITVALTDEDTGGALPVSTADWFLALSPHHVARQDYVLSKALGAGIDVVTGGVSVTLTQDDTDLEERHYYQRLRVDGDTVMSGYLVVT